MNIVNINIIIYLIPNIHVLSKINLDTHILLYNNLLPFWLPIFLPNKSRNRTELN
jgi:hypothetical protein